MAWPLSLAGWAAIPAFIAGTVGYLITVRIQTHQARGFLRYDRALARGRPIGSGAIEGAARQLVADRLAITGSRWSVPGAKALLQLSAIISNGDSPPTGTVTCVRNTHVSISASTRPITA
ncbi:hypothetical protein [Streptomyces sp. NPDC059092]|uniref:hypothetical protein n=1 Tax=Streptomyces sp. NPDC059092 TaxID=3346725 RepID=UPI0036CBC37B